MKTDHPISRCKDTAKMRYMQEFTLFLCYFVCVFQKNVLPLHEIYCITYKYTYLL